MAAKTLAEIRALIRLRGDFKNVRAFPDDYVNNEIQIAFGAFWQLVDEVKEGWWNTETTISCVPHQRFVALPTDVWRLEGVDIQDGSGWDQLDQIAMGQRNSWDNGEENQPEAYRTSARGLELFPPPDAAYLLRIMYTPKAPLLQESQPREWYNGWDDYVTAATLIALATREKMPLGDYEKNLARAEKLARSGVEQRRSQEPEYLNLREGGPRGDRWRDRY